MPRAKSPFAAMDLYVANWTGTNAVYRNVGNRNHWIVVNLIGTASNRPGIGARVECRARIGGADVRQVRQITGGDGAGCADQVSAHFGLGNAVEVEGITVRWPSGVVQNVGRVAVDRKIVVTEPPLLKVRGNNQTGAFELTLVGRGGFDYVIQQSGNLLEWSELTTLTAVREPVTFSVSPAEQTPQRFYRARFKPSN